MVHLYTPRNIIHTIFYACLTFFITPYILVELTGIINTKNFYDPCLGGFIIGFIFLINGYLELNFKNKIKNKEIEYRYIPRNVYDNMESNNLDEQFNLMFDSNDIRLRTNLI